MTYALQNGEPTADHGLARIVATTLVLWAGAVAWAASSDIFVSFPLPLFAALVSVLLIAATSAYLFVPRLSAGVEQFGLRKLTALHIWRIPAALAFYYYGAQGFLPPVFVVLAGTGDLIAGLLALYVVTAKPDSKRAYIVFHIVGMTDFVIAVGTGLTFSLLADPRMVTIALFPLALIPLFGVTISGATHVAAFDLLRRNLGLPQSAERV
ncbi:MAG: permease [Pseudomonadota bacterium]